ncbi:stage II sporulation protein E [Calditerricola satsumensis]|uniref:Stage II sporulation protein E n=3 Tax=Calditerricola satsumensis TaxID=373054 RepID=A0A8J3BAV3_9BACI|nr:stage II sporulation protein E [Calditerricola satsumensis]
MTNAMFRKTDGWTGKLFGPVPWLAGAGEPAERGAQAVQRGWIRWGVPLLVIGFLLGQAVLVEGLAPFAVPFFAVAYHLRRDRVLPIVLALCGGAALVSTDHLFVTILSCAMYLILQLGLERRKRVARSDLSHAPLLTALAVFGAHTGYTYGMANALTVYQAVAYAVEGALSFLLTLIFVQALPLMTSRRYRHPLRQEEAVCALILLGSVLIGTIDWRFFGVAVHHVLAQYFLLVFAFAGGGGIGVTAGVVIGLMLTLADIGELNQMSLLAFAGLLSGLLREARKPGAVAGLLIGASLFTFYMEPTGRMWSALGESLAAAFLFVLTPRVPLRQLAALLPGTHEHLISQQAYMRQVRQATAARIEQFAHLFQKLAHSFAQADRDASDGKTDVMKEMDAFLSGVTAVTCNVCRRKDVCWGEKAEETYDWMRYFAGVVAADGAYRRQIPFEWKRHCLKAQDVLKVMADQYPAFRERLLLNQRIRDSRQLVAEQLSGVSRVMGDFAAEIRREGQDLGVQEGQIREALEEIGLSVRKVDIYNLAEGNVDIEVSQPSCNGRDECEKIVAPLVSDLLGETVAVAEKRCQAYADGYCTMCLRTAHKYRVASAIAAVAKDGGWLSGDSFATLDLGNGRYAVALSDGMGNGERAHRESSETLELLKEMLCVGFDEQMAIKSVNALLSLRTTEDTFATLDLAILDLHTAEAKFLKTGSTPSFIKRGREVFTVTAGNLPIGILRDIEVDVVTLGLKPGDLLIMLTDGVYDAPKVENKERFLKRMIADLATDDPQEVADLLLEQVVRHHHGAIHDDMTVAVVRIDPYVPEWATIKMPRLRPVERPRVVS